MEFPFPELISTFSTVCSNGRPLFVLFVIFCFPFEFDLNLTLFSFNFSAYDKQWVLVICSELEFDTAIE